MVSMEDAFSNHWERVAQQHWLDSIPSNLDAEILRSKVWEPLESQGFTTRNLLPLESLQILERFLWPTFSADSSNNQVILITAFTNVKIHSNLDPWSVLSTRPDEFSILFQRVLSLSLDASISIASKTSILNFIAASFRSLEKEFVRRECAPLVSIAIWHNLHSESHRTSEVQKTPTRQKAWRAVQKKFDNADKSTQAKLLFDRAWLCAMVLDCFRRVNIKQVSSTSEVVYCERFIEFLIDLISQLPTRRYTIVLLKDLNVIPMLRTCALLRKDECAVLQDLVVLYQHFSDLRVDELSVHKNAVDEQDDHYEALAKLQRTCFQHFETKLKVLALSNYTSIDKPGELLSHLSTLTDVELEELCNLLDLRTSYPTNSGVQTGRELFLQILVTAYSQPRDFRKIIRQMSVVPVEQTLYDTVLLRNESYDGSEPLAIPKLNLQYLSLDDFMWRSFQLQQAEAFYEIRKDMEGVVRRMKPRLSRDQKGTHFEGFSKMALPIEKPAIIEVSQPKVGSSIPNFVRAEVVLDMGRLTDRIIMEWESLRPKDTIFLLSVKPADNGRAVANGNSAKGVAKSEGISMLRTAEIVQVLDDKGKPIRDMQNGISQGSRNKKRRLLLDLDPIAYNNDQELLSRGKPDVWASINVIARRQGRENNFKPVLETVQRLVGANAQLSTWLQDVYLGYGDPKSATYPNFKERLDKIDFLDTFLNWEHLQESFPDQKLLASNGARALEPPYVVRFPQVETQAVSQNPKKRRREQMEDNDASPVPVQVSTYKPENTGPYPTDTPKKNAIKFTAKQVSAITSGTQPGLTLIVGPPGTGKTDVATQIINLLYHNNPSERILLVAHSNQALNQLFQKIVALDIDPRHLLRLGHGEGELDTETSYGKYGRVEFFMENRQTFLRQVDRLAASVGASGAHGSTCETADYFNQVYIRPAWSRFWSTANSDAVTPKAIIDAFPFGNFFSDAPVPELLPASASVEELQYIAKGCQHHLDRIFTELESMRPFEILRNPRDQANHLLVKEARVIAMTSTHAAIKRTEIADLGFHYDTLIMEEAAQITEVESFIPCAMQNPDPKSGEMPLKRIVLVGDHLQNSPVVQNLALRQYANYEQSLFLRLVRLGVPTINLDQQGRCRPSIADLFNWRYVNLTNLPHLSSLPEFKRANAGFRCEYQFIDVPDYQGQGEREPTPHFVQNLGEAEYVVALYQYMRLLGYPARSISILATYAGQKALIRDVLEHRCKGNRLFGMPKIVTTVDKYQGEQNDYVILSLVRTKSVGYLRDVRRLTVALSRARLGLYVFGRKELFENCFEMKTAMDGLNQRGGPESKLEVVTGEMYPTERLVNDEVSSVPMDGVEHLGQYVYEMTQAKIKSLGGIASVMDAEGNAIGEDFDQENGDDLQHEADLEEDPLHETVV